MKKLLKIFFSILLFLQITTIAKSEESYVFGGIKLFNYGVETSDLQAINTSLVNLGFSSSTSSTDNSGVGFDFGIGINLSDEFAVEAGFVDYGTLEITTNTTGPTENIKTEIDGNGFTGAAVLRFGEKDDHLFVKGGFHAWEFEGKVTASLGTSSEPLGKGTDLYMAIGYVSDMFYGSYDYYAIEDGSIGSLTFGIRSEF